MNSKHVLFAAIPATLVRQQRQICVQMNRHFDEDACRAMRRGASK